MIGFHTSGSFKNTEAFLKHVSKLNILSMLDAGAKEGVEALANATPVDTRLAANSWDYITSADKGVYTITWTNSDIENGFPVVIMLQFGHATAAGGYVQGRDFINPALYPIFDKIADRVWKAVISA